VSEEHKNMGQDMLAVTRSAVETARKKGAQEASAVGRSQRDLEVRWRDGKVEKIAEATSRGVDLRLFVDGRYSSVSTSDLRPEALDAFIGNAVALTRTLAKDPLRSLPDPALYQGQSKDDLAIVDANIERVTAIDLRRLAEAAEVAARGAPGANAIISVSTSASSSSAERFQASSNGFEGSYRETSFDAGAEVSIKDDDGRRPEDYDYASTRALKELPDAAILGRRAADRAIARRGAKKGASVVTTVVLDARVARSFVGGLMRPLMGFSLQQKRSFLEGYQGKPFGSKLLTVTDDPLLARGLSSRPFDAEGIAARRLPIFDGGALRSYFIDTYYGKKLTMKPTTGSSSNLVWGLGSKDQAGLIGDIKEGLLVTDFLGGNSNDTTGDFSLGVQGYAIRGGKLAEAVGEMNISGSHLSVWKRLVAVGNDPFPYASNRTPTLVLEGVQVAGT
jgi:PmbA protein